jgi:hypothetical protein
MKNIAENVIYSYESSIQSIEAILETTHQLLEGFQDSFLDIKQEREKINGELRESLAKNESLRRKDFDDMMQGILSTQDKREKEVRNLLKTYLNEQKEMARALKENLEKFKDSIAAGEAQRVKEFQVMIKEILAKQDERKDKVTSRLKEFQKEQQETAERLRELLAKGSELRIKDLKSMLKEFKAQHQERVSRQGERREKVHTLLGEFKRERIKGSQDLVDCSKKAQRRNNSPRVK